MRAVWKGAFFMIELIKKEIHMNRQRGTAVSQLTLDDDFIVPDALDDAVQVDVEEQHEDQGGEGQQQEHDGLAGTGTGGRRAEGGRRRTEDGRRMAEGGGFCPPVTVLRSLRCGPDAHQFISSR